MKPVWLQNGLGGMAGARMGFRIACAWWQRDEGGLVLLGCGKGTVLTVSGLCSAGRAGESM